MATPIEIAATIGAANGNTWTIPLRTSAVLINKHYSQSRNDVGLVQLKDVLRGSMSSMAAVRQVSQAHPDMRADVARVLGFESLLNDFDVATINIAHFQCAVGPNKSTLVASHLESDNRSNIVWSAMKNLTPSEEKPEQWFVQQVRLMADPTVWTKGQELLPSFVSNILEASVRCQGGDLQSALQQQHIVSDVQAPALACSLELKESDPQQPMAFRPWKPICDSLLAQTSRDNQIRTALISTLCPGGDAVFDPTKPQKGVVFCHARDVLDINEIDPGDRNMEVAVLFEQHIFVHILAKAANQFVSQVYSFAWPRVPAGGISFEELSKDIPFLYMVIPKDVYTKLCQSAKKLRDVLYAPNLIQLDKLTLGIHELYKIPQPNAKPVRITDGPALQLDICCSLFKPKNRENGLLLCTGDRYYLKEEGLFYQDVRVCIGDSLTKVTRANPINGTRLVAYQYSAVKKALEVYNKILTLEDKKVAAWAKAEKEREEHKKQPAEKDKQKTPEPQKLAKDDGFRIKRFDVDASGAVIDVERLMIEYLLNDVPLATASSSGDQKAAN